MSCINGAPVLNRPISARLRELLRGAWRSQYEPPATRAPRNVDMASSVAHRSISRAIFRNDADFGLRMSLHLDSGTGPKSLGLAEVLARRSLLIFLHENWRFPGYRAAR